DQVHIETFLEMLAAERGAAGNTLAAYRRDLSDFTAFLSQRGRTLTGTLARDVSAYMTATSEAGLAPASRARRLSALRQLFKFLFAEGVVGDDPTAGLTGPKKARALPKTLSVAEVDRLVSAAEQRTSGVSGRTLVRALRLHCLLEILYATGMRVSELVALPRA